jgi:hypothetical protein
MALPVMRLVREIIARVVMYWLGSVYLLRRNSFCDKRYLNVVSEQTYRPNFGCSRRPPIAALMATTMATASACIIKSVAVESME